MPLWVNTSKPSTNQILSGSNGEVRIFYRTLQVRIWEHIRFAPYRRSGLDSFVLDSEPHQAWTGFYASRNVLKGVARRASSQLHAAETLFTRYRISFPDGPVAKDWALDKLRALRWAVSEVSLQNLNTWNGNQTEPTLLVVLGTTSRWHHWHRVPGSGRHVPAAFDTGHDGCGGASGCALPAAAWSRRVRHYGQPLQQDRSETPLKRTAVQFGMLILLRCFKLAQLS